MKSLELVRTAVVLAALLVVPSFVFAADAMVEKYPTRYVELVIPQSAGGGFDLSARALVSVAPEYFGKPVVIRIRAGGSSVIGTQEVIKSKPDGYTLLWAGNHLLALDKFVGEIPFDPIEDLKPVSRLVNWPWVLMVHPDAPWSNFEEFLKDAEANPGKIKVSFGGAMTVAQLPSMEVEYYSKARFTGIPYDGGGPAYQAVIQGDADAVFAVSSWAISATNQGTLRPLAITGKDRHPELPDVPTLRSFGIESDATLWCGLYAPKDTPDALVKKLDGFVQQIIADKSYKKLMANLDNVVRYLGPEDFKQSIMEADAELSKIATALKEAQKK